MKNLVNDVLAEIITAILVQKVRKSTGKREWALVSKKPDKRTGKRKVLYWFGTQKPSKQSVSEQERRIQYWKHQG